MATTKTTDLFIPEVIDAEIKSAVKDNTVFMSDAEVDYDLVGQPGETVTFVTWGNIGEMEELTEDTPLSPAKLSQTTTTATIKEFGKAIEVTYKAQAQGYGDAVNKGTADIKTVMANGLDKNVYKLYLSEATNVIDVSEEEEGNKLSYRNILLANAKLKVQNGEQAKLYIHPDQLPDLLLDPNFVDVAKYSQGAVNPALTSAEVGRISTIRIFKTDLIEKDEDGVYSNILVVHGAAKVKFQKQVDVESDKDILARKFIVAASTLVAMKTVDQNKIVVLKVK